MAEVNLLKALPHRDNLYYSKLYFGTYQGIAKVHPGKEHDALKDLARNPTEQNKAIISDLVKHELAEASPRHQVDLGFFLAAFCEKQYEQVSEGLIELCNSGVMTPAQRLFFHGVILKSAVANGLHRGGADINQQTSTPLFGTRERRFREWQMATRRFTNAAYLVMQTQPYMIARVLLDEQVLQQTNDVSSQDPVLRELLVPLADVFVKSGDRILAKDELQDNPGVARQLRAYRYAMACVDEMARPTTHTVSTEVLASIAKVVRKVMPLYVRNDTSRLQTPKPI